MSRGQQQGILDQATTNSKTDTANATSAFGKTNNSISDYSDQLAKFVSGNPYTKGGEYDQTINTGLSNASDAGANSLKGALQSQVLRTGQNSAASAATAAEGARQNTRDLSSSLADAQQKRIAGETAYNTTGLQAGTVPITANANLYGTSVNAGNAALNTGEDAAKQPGFWDTLGTSFAGALGTAKGGVGG